MKEIGDILKTILEGYDKGGNPLVIDWKFLVGEELSEHSRMIGFDKKILIVEVHHSGWKQIFQMKQGEILERINKHYPDYQIKACRITIKSERKEDIELKKSEYEKSKSLEKKDLTEILDKIQNEEFKEYLKNLNKRSEQG